MTMYTPQLPSFLSRAIMSRFFHAIISASIVKPCLQLQRHGCYSANIAAPPSWCQRSFWIATWSALRIIRWRTW